MTMNDPLALMWAGLAGLGLGAIFFGGLWWTVRKGLSSQRAALWFLGSLLLRLSLVLVGFYFVLGDSWQRLLAGLLGFTVSRPIVTRFIREAAQPSRLAGETGHAP